MVVITIFGVGYGEVKPLETPAEKIFTMMVILAGTTSAVYIVGGFVQMVAGGEINRALDSQRKSKNIESLKNHSIICGFGRMGTDISAAATPRSPGICYCGTRSRSRYQGRIDGLFGKKW